MPAFVMAFCCQLGMHGLMCRQTWNSGDNTMWQASTSTAEGCQSNTSWRCVISAVLCIDAGNS